MDKNVTNPYQKGTMEYLDWATTQHTKATSPEAKAVAQKKTVAAVKPAAKKPDLLQDALDYENEKKKVFSSQGGIADGVKKAFGY